MLTKRLTMFIPIVAAVIGLMVSSTGTASAATVHPGFVAHTETAGLSPDKAMAIPPQCEGGAEFGWFCFYSGPNFTGDAIAAYACENVVIPWSSFGSFDDEMVGTRGLIYFVDGSSWHLPPAPTSGNVNWASVVSVRTC